MRMVVVLAVLLHPGPREARCDEPDDPPPSVVEQLDQVHARWSSGIADSVSAFDRFFGDEVEREHERDTSIIVSLGIYDESRETLRVRHNISVRLALPNIERRLQLVVDHLVETDEEMRRETFEKAYGTSRPDAGLRFVLAEKNRLRISTDAGLRVGGTPQVYGKLRGRLVAPHPVWESRYSQSLEWYSRDGTILDTEMRWTRHLDERSMVRSTSRVVWKRQSDGVNSSQAFSYYHRSSPRRAHQAGVRGVMPRVPSSWDATYSLFYRLRQQLHREWLFLDMTPGIHFPKAYNFRPTPYVGIFVECVFAEHP